MKESGRPVVLAVQAPLSIPADPGNLNLSCRCAEEGVNEKYQSRTVAVLGLELIREWSNTTWSDNCLRRTGIGEHSRENRNPKEGNGVGPRRGFNWSRRGTSVTTPSSRRRSTSEAGFSILEVAFAIAILVIVLVPVSSLLGTIFKVGANSRFEQQATEIASSTLDTEVALGAATLLGETGTTSLTPATSNGQTYLIEMQVAPYDPTSTQCVSPASDPGAMLKVTIWVTWATEPSGATWWLAGSSSANTFTVQAASLVAVPSADINPTLGSIEVTVQGATSESVANVTVTATPSTGTALTVTTTSGGCALFSNITPTSGGTPTWTVSFGSLPGYLTEQQQSTLPTQSSLSVTADTTTSLYMEPTVSPYEAYDQAATVTPVYSVPVTDGVHPAIPSNINSIPLSFYNSNLSVDPYVATSPAQVFPFDSSPGYNVVAGSCGSESAPDGGTVDGQAVNLTAGATVTPSIPLVPAQIYVNYAGSLVSAATVTASVSNATGTGADTNCPTSGTGVMPTLQLGTTLATWTGYQRSPARGHGRRHHKGPTNAILLSTCTTGPCATTTTITSSSVNPSTAGQSVTLTATVTCTNACSGSIGSPTSGTVAFKSAGTSITGCTSDTVGAGGTATCTTTALVVGTDSITGTYTTGASSKWSSSAVSSGYSQVVNTAPTSTALTATPNPNTYGSSATLTATVSCTASGCGTPSGTVTFTNGGTNISGCVTVALSSGVAHCTLSGLNGGSYSVVGIFNGSTNYATSTSNTVTQQVTAASTGTVLASSANPSIFGASVTLTATVTPASGAPAVGTVAFKDGGTTLGSSTLNGSGVATYPTTSLTLGSNSLTAVFTATNTANFGTSTSNTVTQTVNAASTTTVLTATPNPNAYGTSAILTATVSCTTCGTPAGTVTFTNGGTNISGCVTVSLSAGVAHCTLSGLNGGSYTVASSYTPATGYLASTSNSITQQVTAASTSTVLTSSETPDIYGSSLTLTATVTPASGAPATGTVSFKTGSTVLGSAALKVRASPPMPPRAWRSEQTRSAPFSPPPTPANFGTSTGTLSQSVVNVATTTALTANPNPNAYGTSAILTATVSCIVNGCGTPPGTVTFTKSGTNISGCVTVTVVIGCRLLHVVGAQRWHLQRRRCLYPHDRIPGLNVQHDHPAGHRRQHDHRSDVERQPEHVRYLGDVDGHRDPGLGRSRRRDRHVHERDNHARFGRRERFGRRHLRHHGVDARRRLAQRRVQRHQYRQLRNLDRNAGADGGGGSRNLLHIVRASLRGLAPQRHLRGGEHHLQLGQRDDSGGHRRDPVGVRGCHRRDVRDSPDIG